MPDERLWCAAERNQRVQTNFDCGVAAARIADLDDVCCSKGQPIPGCGTTGLPATCSVPCGASLLPLLGDCGILINRIFDGDDGVVDGTATEFVTLRDTCVSISLDELLVRIRLLEADGCHIDTNGVAETTVDMAAAASCTDRKASCGMSVRDELLTCQDDRALQTTMKITLVLNAAPCTHFRLTLSLMGVQSAQRVAAMLQNATRRADSAAHTADADAIRLYQVTIRNARLRTTRTALPRSTRRAATSQEYVPTAYQLCATLSARWSFYRS